MFQQGYIYSTVEKKILELTMDSNQATATVAFQFNAYTGSIAVTSPIQLKEFLLAPIMQGVDTCVLSISQEQLWKAFETAGFNAKYGFANAFQLQKWLFCAYKIPTYLAVPTEINHQKREFEKHFDKYY